MNARVGFSFSNWGGNDNIRVGVGVQTGGHQGGWGGGYRGGWGGGDVPVVSGDRVYFPEMGGDGRFHGPGSLIANNYLYNGPSYYAPIYPSGFGFGGSSWGGGERVHLGVRFDSRDVERGIHPDFANPRHTQADPRGAYQAGYAAGLAQEEQLRREGQLQGTQAPQNAPVAGSNAPGNEERIFVPGVVGETESVKTVVRGPNGYSKTIDEPDRFRTVERSPDGDYHIYRNQNGHYYEKTVERGPDGEYHKVVRKGEGPDPLDPRRMVPPVTQDAPETAAPKTDAPAQPETPATPATTQAAPQAAPVEITDKASIQQAQAKLELLGLPTGGKNHRYTANHGASAEHMDGINGTVTQGSLKAVQKALGLPETGKLDDQTLAKLNDSAAFADLQNKLHPQANAPQASAAPASPEAPAVAQAPAATAPAVAAADAPPAAPVVAGATIATVTDPKKPVVASPQLHEFLQNLAFAQPLKDGKHLQLSDEQVVAGLRTSLQKEGYATEASGALTRGELAGIADAVGKKPQVAPEVKQALAKEMAAEFTPSPGNVPDARSAAAKSNARAGVSA